MVTEGMLFCATKYFLLFRMELDNIEHNRGDKVWKEFLL